LLWNFPLPSLIWKHSITLSLRIRSDSADEDEREDDKGIVWFANWGYGTFASYGTNPGRPLMWLLVLYAAVALSAYFGGANYLNPSFWT